MVNGLDGNAIQKLSWNISFEDRFVDLIEEGYELAIRATADPTHASEPCGFLGLSASAADESSGHVPGVAATALPGESAEKVTAPTTRAPPNNCAWFGGAPEKAAIT